MTIKKRPDGRWLVDATIANYKTGKSQRVRKLFTTKREAQEFERSLIIKQADQTAMPSGVTLAEFVECVYWPAKEHLRPNTLRAYRAHINKTILPALGHLELVSIGKPQIQAMISGCKTKKIATNARETLSSVLSLALELGSIAVNPASFSYCYPPAAAKGGSYYGVVLTTFAEHKRLLTYFAKLCPGEPLERLVVLGLCFGLRKGEILGLNWDDVDFAARTITVERTYCVAEGGAYLDAPKTPRSYRTIPIPAYAYERLSAWSHDGVAVVTDSKGERFNPHTAQKVLKRITRLSYDDGTPLPHLTLLSMRHSFATACIRAGINVSTVSKWLGHCDTSTTYNRYVKPMLNDLKADAHIIDEAFGFGSV